MGRPVAAVAGESGGSSRVSSSDSGVTEGLPSGVTPIGPKPPSDPGGNSPSPGDPPKIPSERPSSGKERHAVIKAVAKWVLKKGTVLGRVVELAEWIYEYSGYITSYGDEPKTLEELQQAVSTPETGYDIHHIVEQTPAEKDGFSRDQIDGADNLVRVPTLKHWQITGWYGTKAKEFGGLTPREYLRGKDWVERTKIGHRALVEHGVLKP